MAWADCTAATQTQAELWYELEQRLSPRPAGARTRDSLLLGTWWHLLDWAAPQRAPHFALGLLPGEERAVSLGDDGGGWCMVKGDQRDCREPICTRSCILVADTALGAAAAS